MSSTIKFHNFDLNELPQSPVNSKPESSKKELKLKIRIGKQVIGERSIVKFHDFDLNEIPRSPVNLKPGALEKEMKLKIRVGKQLIGERMIRLDSKALKPSGTPHCRNENGTRENLKLKAHAKIKPNVPSSSKSKVIAAEEKPPRSQLKRNKAVQEKRVPDGSQKGDHSRSKRNS